MSGELLAHLYALSAIVGGALGWLVFDTIGRRPWTEPVPRFFSPALLAFGGAVGFAAFTLLAIMANCAVVGCRP